MSEDERSNEYEDLRKAILDQRSLMVVVMVVLRLWSRTFLLLQRVPSYGVSEVSAAVSKALASQARIIRGTVRLSNHLRLVFIIPACLELLNDVVPGHSDGSLTE
jgi:hypothetical protein